MLAENFLEGSEIQQKHHRIQSASAMFQKGIYHLFVLRNTDFSDAFDEMLRLYQCVFLICVTQILLDFEGEKINPTRKDLKEYADRDPGTRVTHSQIKNWSGFRDNHALHEVSQHSKRLYDGIDTTRHNLIYRPYMTVSPGGKNWFWEDCTLESLLQGTPSANEVESLYENFYAAIDNWIREDDEIMWFRINLSELLTTPKLTLLLNYARVLNPGPELDLGMLDEIRKYRSQLLSEEIKEEFLDSELKRAGNL